MIVGTGNDITDIRRIEKTLARFGARFEKRVFTEGERKKAASRKNAGIKVVAGTYAKRFAAKEAAAKALGLGLKGIAWKEIEVVNAKSGKPELKLSGKALAHLKKMTPRGKRPAIHLTLTDEYPYAQAFVIIEAV
jgi:holo-[acyl-carrier protein] synthase